MVSVLLHVNNFLHCCLGLVLKQHFTDNDYPYHLQFFLQSQVLLESLLALHTHVSIFLAPDLNLVFKDDTY